MVLVLMFLAFSIHTAALTSLARVPGQGNKKSGPAAASCTENPVPVKNSGDCVLHRSEAFRVSDRDIDRLQRSDASRALGEVGIIRELDALVGLSAHPRQPLTTAQPCQGWRAKAFS